MVRLLSSTVARTLAIEYVQRKAPPPFDRVMRVLLDAAVGKPPGAAPVVVADSAWDGVWDALCDHRIETFLPASLTAGLVTIPGTAVADVRNRARDSAAAQLKLFAALRRTIERLDEAGIEVRVLKGLATSLLDHPDQNQRRTSDVDVFVSTEDFALACDIVENAGASSESQGRRSVRPVEKTFRMADGVEIDVHCRLFRFGPDHAEELFRDPVPLPNGGGLAMRPEARLVHASAHLLVTPPGYRLASSLFDVAVLSESPELKLAETLDLADVFGVRDIVRFAMWLARNVGADSEEPPPNVGATFINRAHLRPNRRVDLETLAVLADLEGLREQVGHLWVQAGGRPLDGIRRIVGRGR